MSTHLHKTVGYQSGGGGGSKNGGGDGGEAVTKRAFQLANFWQFLAKKPTLPINL
jgi:hypothetical protein